MKRSDCIVDCVGPDCEGCKDYKTAKSMKANDKKPTPEPIPEGCFNCRYSVLGVGNIQLICIKKSVIILDIEYKCKKWRIQE